MGGIHLAGVDEQLVNALISVLACVVAGGRGEVHDWIRELGERGNEVAVIRVA
ncbi:hypothetical protein GLA29479_613 [Lysobacter antibioticus]|nr:hypothetical protein GLA29479_613 [Lysobacter antibioticus]